MTFPPETSAAMLEERGQVVALRADSALVRAASRVDCARCAAGEGCGGGLIGRLLGDRLEVVEARVDADAPPAAGDQVVLSVPARVLVEAAAIAYLLPLAVLLAALALAGDWLVQAPAWRQLGFAAAALLAGLALARVVARRRRTTSWRPRARVLRARPAAGRAGERRPCG